MLIVLRSASILKIQFVRLQQISDSYHLVICQEIPRVWVLFLLQCRLPCQRLLRDAPHVCGGLHLPSQSHCKDYVLPLRRVEAFKSESKPIIQLSVFLFLSPVDKHTDNASLAHFFTNGSGVHFSGFHAFCHYSGSTNLLHIWHVSSSDGGLP
jgi:hypothetical protein